MEGQVGLRDVDVRPDQLQDLVLVDSMVASVEQEAEDRLRLARPGLVAAPPGDRLACALDAHRPEHVDEQRRGLAVVLDEGLVQDLGPFVGGRPLLGQDGRATRPARLRCDRRAGPPRRTPPTAEQLLVVGGERGAVRRRPHPELAEDVTAMGQRDRLDDRVPGAVALAGDDLAVGTDDGQSGHRQGIGQAIERRTDASLGRSVDAPARADRSQDASTGPDVLVVAGPGSIGQSRRHWFIERDDDDEDERAEQGQVDAGERLGRPLDHEQER